MRKKVIIKATVILFIIICITFQLSGCLLHRDEPVSVSVPTTTQVVDPEPENEPPVKSESIQDTETVSELDVEYVGPRDPLSGLPVKRDISSQRPYAVMINNLSTAQPQLGISKAGIVFETLAEGGITRMLALFTDVSDIGPIGSIRSARPYYLDLAEAFDSIFIHAGGSNDAYDEMITRGIPHVDGVNGRDDIFYRDSQRLADMGYEHSLVTSGDLISEYVPTYGFRMEHDSSFDWGMNFADDVKPLNGEDAKNIRVYFSGYTNGKSTSFEFCSEKGGYLVYQYGEEYIDGNTNEQLCPANIIVINTSIWSIDDEGRLAMNLTGTGNGFYYTNGKYANINWSKNDESSQFIFSYENGSEITYNYGQTYVCIVPNSAIIEIEN